MELLEKKCPSCKSHAIRYHRKYKTKGHGTRTMYQCEDCSDCFSETKNTFMEGVKRAYQPDMESHKGSDRGTGVECYCQSL